MVVFTPAIAAAALMIMPELSSLVGKLTGKEKEGEILGTILSLPGMAAGVLGKSPSIAKTTTSTEGSGLQIKPPINNEGVQQGIFNRPRNILGIPGQEDSMYNIFGA